jgi:hypothetical protein
MLLIAKKYYYLTKEKQLLLHLLNLQEVVRVDFKIIYKNSSNTQIDIIILRCKDNAVMLTSKDVEITCEYDDSAMNSTWKHKFLPKELHKMHSPKIIKLFKRAVKKDAFTRVDTNTHLPYVINRYSKVGQEVIYN